MSIETTPTTRIPAAPSTAPAPATLGARSVATSLGVGVVAALVLVLVVFPGGREHAVTGSVLIGFGLGWALLAGRLARVGRPRRWAEVPAVAMAAAGLALVVLAPGYAALGVLSWLWPPVVVALAAWMFAQVRRTVTGRGRWLLLPVIVALGLSAVGALAEDVARVTDPSPSAAPGTTYLVNGHRLHLDCHGTGAPTVVLHNGLAETAASWSRIMDQVATGARVCAYDRAGQGWSEAAAGDPQDGREAAADLHSLLARAGESGPFVMVGHSTGGTYAMTYAAQYPGQVAGLVLLDSSSPEQLTTIPSFAGQYAVTRRGIALLPTAARLGLARVFGASTRSLTNVRDEQSVLPEVFAQAQDLTTLGGRPLAVVTASENLATDGWEAAQRRLALLSSDVVHTTSTSSHAGLLEDDAPAADSVSAITGVLRAVRTGSPVASR